MLFTMNISSPHTFSKITYPILADKLNLSNAITVPSVPYMALSISLMNVATFDSSRLVASFFLLRLLSGQQPYVSRFGIFQTFKKSDYDIGVRVTLSKLRTEDFLVLLSRNILPFVSKSDYSLNFSKIEKSVVVTYTINDLSFIRVIETHSAFFKWHDRLVITLYLNVPSLNEAKQLLSILNLYRS